MSRARSESADAILRDSLLVQSRIHLELDSVIELTNCCASPPTAILDARQGVRVCRSAWRHLYFCFRSAAVLAIY